MINLLLILATVDRSRWVSRRLYRFQGLHTYNSPSGSDKRQVSERDNAPKQLSFGWQRATLLGAFFNGVFLLGLGLSIFLQSIERFVSIESMCSQHPRSTYTDRRQE